LESNIHLDKIDLAGPELAEGMSGDYPSRSARRSVLTATGEIV
jgi:hypothetical protein